MNVLMLINSFNLGGAEKLAYDISKSLSGYKDCNIILCSMGKIETKLEKSVQSKLSNQEIVCITLNKGYRKNRMQTLFRLKRIIQKYEIDIIHSNGQSPDFYARLLRMFMHKIKVVTVIHNTSGYNREIEQIQGLFTDEYVAVSAEAKVYGQRKLGITKDITIIENGINVNNYLTLKPTFSPFVILTVARIAEQKDFDLTVDLIAPFLQRHREARWIIYGNYSEHKAYFERINEKIQKYQIANSVKFMGVETNYKKIYGHASCFFLASKYEGFGIVFIEAMAAGLPVFGRKVGVLKEISEDGGNFFDIDCIDSDIILEKLYNKQLSIDSMVEKNTSIIMKRYSLNINAKKYYGIYKKMLRK